MNLFLRILKANRAGLIWLFLFTLLPIASSGLSSWLAYQYNQYLQELSAIIWVAIYTGIAFGMGLALIPTTFVALLGGYLLGFHSLFYMIPAYLLAAGIGFFIGQRLDGGRLLHSIKIEPQLRLFLARLNDRSWQSVATAKLSPALPFGISNLLLAWLGIRWKPFLKGSFLGMIPRTVIATGIGWQLQQLGQSWEDGLKQPIGIYITIGLFMASVYLFWRIFKS